MNASKLHLYSFGVVAVNKPLNTMSIEVTPMEDLNMVDGELTDNLNEGVVKGQDATGAKFEAKVQGSATVTAEWLPFSSNRKTPPDVRRGEKVAIWKFADSDKYWWSELEYNAKLRKLETVVFMFSNTKKEEEDATKDTTYFLEISTHNKLIQLHTSKNDGEPFTYDIVLNTKEGNFRIADDADNVFYLDSPAKRLLMHNTSGSFLDIAEEVITMSAVKTINLKAGDGIHMESGSVITGKTNNVAFTTPKFSTSAEFSTGSNAQVGGALGIAQGMTTGTGGGGGDISLNGNITGNGNARFSGTVNAQAVRAPSIVEG